LTELSICHSSMYAGFTKDIRVMDPVDNHNKIWRGNLACNIIEKEKNQSLANSYNHQKNLEIFYLNQLLNSKNSELIMWQQLKKARSGSTKGKKAKWFVEVERQTLQNSSSRLVKDSLSTFIQAQQGQMKQELDNFQNQRSGSWKLERIKKKKERKLLVEHWLERKKNSEKYLAVRYMHCALNKKEKENNCITKIKVENVKGCILNMIRNKENWFLLCTLDLLLRKQDVLTLTELKLIDLIE
ncbi:1336_t:CDS:2, partial [Gigaspora margarita]